MPKRTVNFRERLLEDLANPEEAALYLNAAAEDSEEMLLVALRDIAEAKQMAHVAEQAGVAREALYRMLSKSGNPTYSSLRSVLTALGIRMRFATVETLDSGIRRDSTNTPNAIGASRPAEMQAAAKKSEPSREQAVSSGWMHGGTSLIAGSMLKQCTQGI